MLVSKTYYIAFLTTYVVMMCGCDDVKENERGEVDMNSKHSNSTFVTCELRTELDSSEDVIAEVTFANRSNVSICIEKRLLLINRELDGASFFCVRRNSVIVPYHGLLIKRKTPGPEDYYELFPDESVSASIRLQDFFDISLPGRYTISYEIFFMDPKTDMAIEVKSNTVEFERWG